MAGHGSVTHWIELVKRGDPQAAGALWQRYFERLLWLAAHDLHGYPCRIADEEDVVLDAFASFYRAAREGRIPGISDRDSLWRLLVQLTARKAVDLLRYCQRQKRMPPGKTPLGGPDSSGSLRLDEIAGTGPTPQFAAIMAEECARLLALLETPNLKDLAAAKLEGLTNEEIAAKCGCSIRSVERRLHLIRKKWQQELHHEG
jgi:DNA-directed RNA polymerase specialized sigma24 family protein